MHSVFDISRDSPAVDITYFPDIASAWRFWCSSTQVDLLERAWFVYSSDLADYTEYKSQSVPVRLVRAGRALPPEGSACVSTLNPSQQVQRPAGGSGTVPVAAPADCAWRVLSNTPWIQVSTGQSGTGNGDVTYQVGANTQANGRLGTLTIGGRTFTVWQAGTTAAVGPADLRGTIRNAATGQPLGGRQSGWGRRRRSPRPAAVPMPSPAWLQAAIMSA